MKKLKLKLNIGKVKLKNNLIMAPMAGITDLPFRSLVKEGGAGLVCTEMVSAKAVIHEDRKTKRIYKISKKEHPISAQIFGSDPKIMAEAAAVMSDSGADIIDLNFGCPVRKINKSGSGAKLLENEKLMADIMEAVVSRVKIPVTIKTRIGQNPDENVAPQVVKLAEQCGIEMVVVHGRSASVGHSGDTNLDAIAEAVRNTKIPVVGNGGIFDEYGAKDFLDKTGCSGLMLGRGAVGNPEIFSRIEKYLKTGVVLHSPSWEERLKYLKKHAKLASEYYGEKIGLTRLRKVAPYYLKGLPNASKIRNEINRIITLDELNSLLEKVWKSPYFAEN